MFQIVIERCYVMLLRQTMYLNSYDHTLKLVHNHLALLAGSVAEWSKALVLGTSHFGGVGSYPTAVTTPVISKEAERGFRDTTTH